MKTSQQVIATMAGSRIEKAVYYDLEELRLLLDDGRTICIRGLGRGSCEIEVSEKDAT